LPFVLSAAFGGCSNTTRPEGYDPEVRILVFAPHPDDETIGFGGLLRDAVVNGTRVHVVVVTDGDAYVDACYFWKNGCPRGSCPPGAGPVSECTPGDLAEFGLVRRQESIAALRLLGVPEGAVTFWGYPDSKLADMRAHPDSVIQALSSNRTSTTGKPFRGRSVEEDVEEALLLYPRATIYTTHARDGHRDHSALAGFVQDARRSIAAVSGERHVCYWALIHDPHSGSMGWPPPACTWGADEFTLRELRYTPTAALPAPPEIEGAPIVFAMREEMWNPSSRTPPLLREAFDLYKTEYGGVVRGGRSPGAYTGCLDASGYLLSFVKRNHLFWEAPAP
jgi:LmbE family N-acetylglucosaminyl deacetylase